MLQKHCKVQQENLHLFTSPELPGTTIIEIVFLLVLHKIGYLLQNFYVLPLYIMLVDFFFSRSFTESSKLSVLFCF